MKMKVIEGRVHIIWYGYLPVDMEVRIHIWIKDDNFETSESRIVLTLPLYNELEEPIKLLTECDSLLLGASRK